MKNFPNKYFRETVSREIYMWWRTLLRAFVVQCSHPRKMINTRHGSKALYSFTHYATQTSILIVYASWLNGNGTCYIPFDAPWAALQNYICDFSIQLDHRICQRFILLENFMTFRKKKHFQYLDILLFFSKYIHWIEQTKFSITYKFHANPSP